MTLTAISSLTAGQQKADAVAATPEQQKAARDFEAIFLRQLLSSLEKGSGMSGGQSSGGAVFRSMMVSAMADKAAEGGGIGLSELILKAMLPPTPQAKLGVTQHELTQHLAAAQRPHHSEASASGADPLDALSAAAANGAGPTNRAVDPTAGLPTRSARLGVSSQVLTEARPERMLHPAASRQQASPIQPGGSRR